MHFEMKMIRSDCVAKSASKTLLVISHYDRRPIKDLLRLLRSMAKHRAGADFDVCVVVNRECGRQLDLSQQPFPVTISYRPNVGMNIGAWDHGWRENPGYDHYIFLQDECVILRHDWLHTMLDCLARPGVGMVGESVNDSWYKTWAELTAEESEGGPEKNGKCPTYAKRARICLEFMRERNISAGATGQHLRSLIWGFSKETLSELGGFPIGKDYDECIAAEIAVSRHVVGRGLSLSQVHRIPFYYVTHSQWINTYPGFSSSLAYGDWARRRLAVKSPFLSFVGKGDTASRIEQLVKRVETERGLFDEGVLCAPREGIIALLVMFIDQPPSDSALKLTALSWCLQSAPHIDVLFVATNALHLGQTKEWMANPDNEQFSKIRLLGLSDWLVEDLEGYRFLLFGRPGDQFHPSLASTLALLDVCEGPDIVVWNEEKRHPSKGGRWLLQQPRFEPFTTCASAHIGLAFAIRPCWVKEFPYNFVDDLLHHDSHLFHTWLSHREDFRWTTHPEFLTSRLINDASPELAVAHDTTEEYQTAYREIVVANGDFEVISDRNVQFGCRMIPVRRAGTISVIVSFRDRSQETIACLNSLIRQQVVGHLEIILINNRSGDEDLSAVKDAVEVLRKDSADIRLVDYDSPFNHSRQTNLGARLSSGDVFVFLNNDAELLDPGVLEEMAAWALVPGIGTVSCKIVGENGELLCAGIRVRPVTAALYVSPVEESREIALCDKVREVVANTFACAAVSRSNFEMTGWLNEFEFPNGYNDVEYCLRCRQKGLRNLYLGHLLVKHTPGTSRGRTDESFQKILLKQRYAELATESVFQLSCEWIPRNSAAATKPAEEPHSGLKKALKVLYRAMTYWAQKRMVR